ncbi:hypothetical protein [Urechidicola vernalis]|uniref:Uncharacterized protein n=1 Tax=Urechidicola vernalis TaxID=3075600 RepID=A0ABU2Y0S9_9FLAO|nr:hypothetical protein [Urechidicola sp. P050]MDT0551784.1 hypothetical protein [Urechidicola sp. P050]
MDDLDKLKGAWKKQDYSKHKVSINEIYKMLHAKSSSYVKWIFYISIIEFVLMNSIMFFRDMDKDMAFYKEIGLYGFISISSYATFAVVIGFIYAFYKNYRSIKVDSNAKLLMANILKTRKTVKYYIYFNVGAMTILMGIMFYYIFSNPNSIALYKEISNIPQDFDSNTFLIFVVVFTAALIGVVLLIYRVIYGILLRRLNRNYRELEQLES